MEDLIETLSMEDWIIKASDNGFTEEHVKNVWEVSSLLRNPQHLHYFGNRLFKCILKSDHSNDRSTDSVHITVGEQGQLAVTFDLELESISGYDIKLYALSENIIFSQVFTETWSKGKKVQTLLFNLTESSFKEIDVTKEIAFCCGLAGGTFIYVEPNWPSIGTLYNAMTGEKKICQVCTFKEWPAAIVPDPRPMADHQALILVSQDKDIWKYGAEGDIIKLSLDNGAVLQQLNDPRFSSELLQFTRDAEMFVAYRKRPPEILVYSSDSMESLKTLSLGTYCPFLELPFDLPLLTCNLQDTDLLPSLPGCTVALTAKALNGLSLRPDQCFLMVPIISKTCIALVCFDMALSSPVIQIYSFNTIQPAISETNDTV